MKISLIKVKDMLVAAIACVDGKPYSIRIRNVKNPLSWKSLR